MGARSWTFWLLSLVLVHGAHLLYAASVGWEFAVIIDAGSTGSRAHVYRYYTASSNNSPWAAVELPEAVYRTSPGLSSYAFDPKTAANSLKPLLKFAKEKVPEDQWKSTPIQLMATAGLRMLSNGTAEAIMSEVRALLASSGFDYQAADGARVLTGREEGVWGWVAVNYATGALQAATTPDIKRSHVLLGRKDIPQAAAAAAIAAAPLQGVLELGGASMQVTFMPRDKLPAGQAAELTLPGLGPDRIYSYSFDGLGLQAAQATWIDRLTAGKQQTDPCLPSGYTSSGQHRLQGSSDWGACKAGVKQLLPMNETCLYKRCGMNGAYLPNVDGTVFLGLDNFHYTAKLLALPTNKRISVDQLEKAAASFCSQKWRSIRGKYLKHGSQAEDSHALKACFSSALIISILKDGLRLNTSIPLLLASNSVQTPKGENVEVNWALGALIVEVLQLGGQALSKAHDHLYIATAGSEDSASDAAAAMIAVSFCLLMLVLTSCAAYFRAGVSAPAVVRLSVTAGPVSPVGGGLGSIAVAINGLVQQQQQQQSGGSAGGVQSSVRYQRVRAVSPTLLSNAVSRPGSANVTSGGGRSGGGLSGAAVQKADGAAAAGVDSSRASGSVGSAMHQAKQR